MVTELKRPRPRPWHRSVLARSVTVIGGAFLLLVGSVAWALETEYGGDVDRPEYTISHEVGEPVKVHGEAGVVFEGTQSEVDAWLEEERGSRNYAFAVLLFASGIGAIAFGVWPSRRT